MFNTYANKTKTIGGSLPVWLEINGKKVSGYTLNGTLSAGDIVPAGSPVYAPKVGGKANVLKFFKVLEAVTSTGTEIKVRVGLGLPSLKIGDVIMKVPATLAGTGVAYDITAVSESTDADGQRIATVTLSTTLGALAVGDILTIGSASGTGKDMAVTSMSGLTENDVYAEEDGTTGTCAIVDDGRIMADRIQPIPAIFKALVPNIKFEEGI